eukprot:8466390-Pyramimonas_sp.AAC.1
MASKSAQCQTTPQSTRQCQAEDVMLQRVATGRAKVSNSGGMRRILGSQQMSGKCGCEPGTRVSLVVSSRPGAILGRVGELGPYRDLAGATWARLVASHAFLGASHGLLGLLLGAF